MIDNNYLICSMIVSIYSLDSYFCNYSVSIVTKAETFVNFNDPFTLSSVMIWSLFRPSEVADLIAPE